jgi:predicted AAA+ superfamily ATPase
LLYVISTSVPFKPNITELSSKTGIARDTLLRYLNHLEEAHLITLLKSEMKGNSILTKPEKIYLRNSNLMESISEENTNIGTIRETFFLNQLSSTGKLYYTEIGYFMFEGKYYFEVGGKNKDFRQLKEMKNAYIAADEIETGAGNKIPLWLFGFLY